MKKAFFIILIYAVLTAMLASLQFLTLELVDQSKEKTIYSILEYIHSNKLEFSVILSLSIVFIGSIDRLLLPRKYSTNLRKTIIDTMIKELFDDDALELRVTLFRDAGFFRNNYYRAKDKIGFIKNKSSSTISFKQLFAKQYLYVHQRVGVEYSKSKTYFSYSDKSHRDCQGIVGVVRHNLERVIVKDLPNIDNVSLDSVDLNRKRTSVVRDIRDYMAKTYISDFHTLKRLNKKARHYYGDVAYSKSGEPVGVIVIDSFKDISPFSDDTINKLGLYYKILGESILL